MVLISTKATVWRLIVRLSSDLDPSKGYIDAVGEHLFQVRKRRLTDTTAIGRLAETAAAAYLEQAGYEILDRNWRNRYCELDIVARGNGVARFVEVKYRSNTAFGHGYEYVGRDKQARLIRAAAAWCQAHHYVGDYAIDVVSVTGQAGALQCELIEDII